MTSEKAKDISVCRPIGINLLLWTDSPSEASFPLLEQIRDIGFNMVELSVYSQSISTMEKLGREMDRLGLLRTAATTCSKETNLISADATERRNGIEYLRQILDRCSAAGCSTLVGPLHSALGVFSGTGPTEDERKRCTDGLREVAEYAETVKVKLALEPVNRFECYFMNTAEQGAEIVRRVDHPFCRMMYDTFHSHIEEKSIPAAIESIRDSLIHVHISENDRSTPGKGQVRWQETFKTLKEIGYTGPMVIEAFGSSLPNLTAATKIWRRMFDNEMALAADGLTFIRKNNG